MKYPNEITLTIKKEDFKGARYGDNRNCPIARAVKRRFKHNYVSVGDTINLCFQGASIGYDAVNKKHMSSEFIYPLIHKPRNIRIRLTRIKNNLYIMSHPTYFLF